MIQITKNPPENSEGFMLKYRKNETTSFVNKKHIWHFVLQLIQFH